jgi:uncharacterized protein YbjT (DUF2867 family)
MHLLVLGATGGIGRHVVDRALAAGHTVTAFVRTPSKLHRSDLTVLEGDARDGAAVAAACAGVDAVVVAIGGGLSERTVRTEATQNALAGMVEHDVQRIVAISSIGAGGSGRQLGLVARAIVKTMLRSAIADHDGQEAALRASDRQYTILRPPGLSDEVEVPFRVIEGDERVGGARLPRASVAAAVLQALDEERWMRQAVAVVPA